MTPYSIQVDETRDGRQIESIVCGVCGMQSYCPIDIAMKYCGGCNTMHNHRNNVVGQILDIIAYSVPEPEIPVNWKRDGF